MLALLARAFGPESFGSYVALLSAAVLGLILIEAGWPTLLYRESVDAGPEGTPAERTAMARAVAHVVSIGLILCLIAWLAGGAMRLAAAVAYANMTLLGLSNLISARMRGRGRFALDALWQCGGRLASAALILFVIMQIPATAEVVFASWSVAVAILLLLWGRFWLAPPSWRGLMDDYRYLLPFLAINGGIVFLLRGDMSVLGALGLPPTELSFYAAGTRFTEAAVLMFAAVTNVLLRTFRLRAHDAILFRRELRFALTLALGTGMLALTGSLLLGQWVMTQLFGPEYRAAGDLLPWITASLPLMLMNLVLIQAAAARGRETHVAGRLFFACALLALGLHFGSVCHGVRGAAAGVAVAHGALLVMLLQIVRRDRGAGT